MTDDTLRLLERSWQSDPTDERALDRFLEHLRRTGMDPIDGLAEAAGDASWAGLVRASLPIVRTCQSSTEVSGRRLLVFVRNRSYFVSHADVYADGVIDAWGGVDRALFARKLSDRPGEEGPPVVTTALEGADLSIHNLGRGAVANPSWHVDRADVKVAADMILRAFGTPERDLLDLGGTSTEERDGIRYAKIGLLRPCFGRRASGRWIKGTAAPVLVRDGSRSLLASWVVYEDGLGQIDRGPLVPFEEVAARLRSGELVTALEDGATLVLPGLGEVTLTESYWYVSPEERIAEMQDELEKLRGGGGSHARCRRAFEEYESEAARSAESGVERSELTAARERLRAAYLSVPEHLRAYLGDMDSKDWPIRSVLFPEERADDSDESTME